MRRSWTGPALLALAAAVLLGTGTPALASPPVSQPQNQSHPDLILVTGDPAVGPIVNQYGDPDDAITGNRGPAAVGATSGAQDHHLVIVPVPVLSSGPLADPGTWLPWWMTVLFP